MQMARFGTVQRTDCCGVLHRQVYAPSRLESYAAFEGRSYNVRRATMEAAVTMPELTGVELSGASRGTVTGFRSTQALDVDLSGSSSLRGNNEAGNWLQAGLAQL
jgi:hypothetical protein